MAVGVALQTLTCKWYLLLHIPCGSFDTLGLTSRLWFLGSF